MKKNDNILSNSSKIFIPNSDSKNENMNKIKDKFKYRKFIEQKRLFKDEVSIDNIDTKNINNINNNNQNNSQINEYNNKNDNYKKKFVIITDINEKEKDNKMNAIKQRFLLRKRGKKEIKEDENNKNIEIKKSEIENNKICKNYKDYSKNNNNDGEKKMTRKFSYSNKQFIKFNTDNNCNNSKIDIFPRSLNTYDNINKKEVVNLVNHNTQKYNTTNEKPISLRLSSKNKILNKNYNNYNSYNNLLNEKEKKINIINNQKKDDDEINQKNEKIYTYRVRRLNYKTTNNTSIFKNDYVDNKNDDNQIINIKNNFNSNENKDNYNNKIEIINKVNKTPNNNNHMFSNSTYYKNKNRNRNRINMNIEAYNQIQDQKEKNVKPEGDFKRLKKYSIRYIRYDNDNLNKIKESKEQKEDNNIKNGKTKIDREIKYIKSDKNNNNGKCIIIERNNEKRNGLLKPCKSNNDLYQKYKIQK